MPLGYWVNIKIGNGPLGLCQTYVNDDWLISWASPAGLFGAVKWVDFCCQSEAEDDAGAVPSHKIPAESKELPNKCSTSDAADDTAVSTPSERHTDVATASPRHITVDVSIAAAQGSDFSENPVETPTSPKDAAGQRSNIFSKRAGINPSTPPVKDARGKKSSPVHEERPKSNGCCVIF